MKLYLGDLARLFLVLREQLCNGNSNHAMRQYITVKKMEQYTKYIDSKLKG